jgi:ribonuclease-3
MKNIDFKTLEEKIQYSFNDKTYLEMALSHPSLKQTDSYKFDYQRLEFLGDSVLSIVITKRLYNLYADFNEGQLAQFRNYLISKDVIYKVAYKIDLQIYLIMTQGEEKSGGRENIGNLENSLEALIAAIYIDSDYSLLSVENFVLSHWQEFFESYNDFDDPKSYIQIYSQSLGLGVPIYNVIKQEGSSHSPIFRASVSLKNNLTANSSGKSIKEAQKNAAKNLISIIKKTGILLVK